MFFKKDNIFTIPLPGSDLVFTRYLYIKDEVRISLLVSLLNKSDNALFWAYELFYSGFQHELFKFIFEIYYDFYYILNPSFEQFLFTKYIESQGELSDILLGSLIQNLLYRPFNLDVFMLRQICSLFEIETNYELSNKISNLNNCQKNFSNWIKNNDFRSISNWLLNENKKMDLLDIYEIILDEFAKLGIKLVKSKLLKDFQKINLKMELITNVKIILLAKIMSLFAKKEKLKMGRSIYITVTEEEIDSFKTISHEKSYNVLKTACTVCIDEFNFLSLFKLKRRKYKIKDKYWYNWLYHASFSPVWSKRIQEFGGFPDYINQIIVFKEDPSDDLMQKFYSKYGYEPDEQSLEVQNKNIPEIINLNNWKNFYNKFNKNTLVDIYDEELEELDIEGLIY